MDPIEAFVYLVLAVITVVPAIIGAAVWMAVRAFRRRRTVVLRSFRRTG
jgi:hypothetical protein